MLSGSPSARERDGGEDALETLLDLRIILIASESKVRVGAYAGGIVSCDSAFEFRPIGKPSAPRLTDSGCKFVALIRRFTVRSGSPTVTTTAASVRSSGARGEADEKMGKLVLSSRAAKAASSLHGRRRLRAPDDSRARETVAISNRGEGQISFRYPFVRY